PAVLSTSGNPLSLVRTIATRSFAVGRSSRRRNGLARRWERILVVVFRDIACDLLHDRSQTWCPGPGQILSPRVRGNTGHRFLGSLQLGRLRCATGLLGTLAEGFGICRKVQVSEQELAEFRQEAAPTFGRQHPFASATRRSRDRSADVGFPPHAIGATTGRNY